VKRPVDKAGLKCLHYVIERESVKNRKGEFQESLEKILTK